ncbi:CPBP family intramembrane glutamic endopeptidase [Pediococcus ethanolidurans]|uniref:CPBP family intramembrane glutamic endopeptidase n=1 Tax=Pediococcus ethanolidurans TaxID=319653 RepID=UPI0021AAA2F2|nr:CPBP family intramembrane glutamic endopeptidase [Pediococcus ethanolidurans]MCT4398835.1 CPBP family intramembrane metalloprotease [Pediococcus ethanolidurans]MCV3554931.1 CPBP family intramembrane metalloprotease [Pediococcus ethanolidurans]
MVNNLSVKYVRVLKQWYIWQLGVMFIAFCLTFFWEPFGPTRLVEVIFGALAVILGIGIPFEKPLKPEQKLKRVLRKCNYCFQAFSQFLLLPLGLAAITLIFHKILLLNYPILAILAMLYVLIMYLPATYYVLVNIRFYIGRLILITIVIFETIGSGSVLSLMYTRPKEIGAVLQTIDMSGIVNALAFILTVGFLMYLWGFKQPSWRLSHTANWLVVGFVIVVLTALVVWNGFGTGDKLSNIFTSYDFSLGHFNLKIILQALETISEEWAFRFAVLFLSLKAFSHRKNQYIWVVVLNGVLFGLWHASNLLAGQSVSATLNQMLFAFGGGIILSAAYLYTQSLAVTMISHFFLDVLAFSNMNGNLLMGAPDGVDWIATWIVVIVLVLVALFLVTGKRKQSIQRSLVY